MTRRPLRSSQRGVALIIVLLLISLLSALGLGLALTSSTARLAGSNHHESVALLNAADAALALVSRDLAAMPDWSAALDGSVRSAYVDAPVPGMRVRPGGVSIDPIVLTNELTCGFATVCSDARVRLSTAERPWGSNNPRWQPFLYTSLESVAALAGIGPAYVIVWLGDDPSESDGDPAVDGGGEGHGRYVVRARAEAWGVSGARRAVEAALARVCADIEGIRVCRPGIRVQSWRAVTSSFP